MYFPVYKAVRSVSRAGRPKAVSRQATEIDQEALIAAAWLTAIFFMIVIAFAVISEAVGSDGCWLWYGDIFETQRHYCELDTEWHKYHDQQP